MVFAHEKLNVYQYSLQYVAWVYERADRLLGKHSHAKDQWLRACQSIPLNIAEGNGKACEGDRRRSFEIARGSALECAAIQDVLEVGQALTPKENLEGKAMLNSIVAMLTGLGKRAYSVKEELEPYAEDKPEEVSDEAEEANRD